MATMKDLQLSLKNKWFFLTKTRIKPEDYRELTPYWFNRLVDCKYPKEENGGNETILEDILFDLRSGHNVEEVLKAYWCTFKHFKNNIMTLGYPKSTDTERIVRLEHLGIEIGTGRVEWGA